MVREMTRSSAVLLLENDNSTLVLWISDAQWQSLPLSGSIEMVPLASHDGSLPNRRGLRATRVSPPLTRFHCS